MADLTTRIAEALVDYTTAGLCPLTGPCDNPCDCFEPTHPRERDMADLAVQEVATYLRELAASGDADLQEFIDRHGLWLSTATPKVLRALADEIEGDKP